MWVDFGFGLDSDYFFCVSRGLLCLLCSLVTVSCFTRLLVYLCNCHFCEVTYSA